MFFCSKYKVASGASATSPKNKKPPSNERGFYYLE